MTVSSPVVELPVDLKVPDVCVELIKEMPDGSFPPSCSSAHSKFPQIGRIVRGMVLSERFAEEKDIDMFLDKRAVVFVQSEPPVNRYDTGFPDLTGDARMDLPEGVG